MYNITDFPLTGAKYGAQKLDTSYQVACNGVYTDTVNFLCKLGYNAGNLQATKIASLTDIPTHVMNAATMTTDENQDPVGVVSTLGSAEVIELQPAGAIICGDEVFADATGKITAFPTVAGTYNLYQVGIALETGTSTTTDGVTTYAPIKVMTCVARLKSKTID